jgi:hypothetical protein
MASDPVFIAYTAKRAKSGKRPVWTRIGQAYPHDSGAGLTLVLDAMPLDGRVILLELDESDHARILDWAHPGAQAPDSDMIASPRRNVSRRPFSHFCHRGNRRFGLILPHRSGPT